MTDLKITVYTELGNAEFTEALRKVTPPRNVIITFSDITDGSITDFPEDREHLVITDSRKRIDSLSKLSGSDVRIVFVGKAKLTRELDDVWDTGDADEIAVRFSRLLERHEAVFRAGFYEHTLRTTIDTVPDMLWFKRLDGIHTMVNTAFTNVVHKTRDDIIGRDHFYIWDAPRPAEGNQFACAESEEKAISTGKTYICEEAVACKPRGVVGVGHDVTNFSNLGIELHILVENLPFPMIIFTADMKVVRMNEAFMKIAEITSGEEAKNFDFTAWRKHVLMPVKNEIVNDEKHLKTQEFKIYGETGERFFIVTTQEIHDYFDNISGYFLMMNDITYQRAYEESILKAANTDMLTGMYNRRFFYNHLSENSEKPMTLFYMDLDRFKYVNDHYGHAKGDEVLIRTAQVIRTRFPKAVSARLGGDEFVILMQGHLTREIIGDKVRQMTGKLKEFFLNNTKYQHYSISVGCAIFRQGEPRPDYQGLFDQADHALYVAKNSGKDRCIIYGASDGN